MRSKLSFFTLILLLFARFHVQAQGNTYTPQQLLENLIQFESVSGQEKEIGQYLMTYCEQKGLFVENLSYKDSVINFSASLYPLSLGKPNIILHSHLDVVPVSSPELWTHPAYAGESYQDTIWGRGAIDCKGLAVMQLEAIFSLINRARTEDLPYNITFLGLSGEETGNPYGAKYVTEQFLQKLNAIVVFGEGGSGLQELVPSKPELPIFGISVAEKSSLWLKLEARKKTHGHGAVPPDLYANKRLVRSLIKLLDQKREIKFDRTSRRMFRELGTLEGGMRGFVIKHINWIIFWPFVKKYFRPGEIFNVLVTNTFVITEISTIGNGAINQIGNVAFAILDCRLLPGEDTKRFLRRMQFAVGSKIEITILSESPNTSASKPSVFLEHMQAALAEIHPNSKSTPILFPASTDNNFFRLSGIPTYGIIPVIFDRVALEGVHGENEYLLQKDLLS